MNDVVIKRYCTKCHKHKNPDQFNAGKFRCRLCEEHTKKALKSIRQGKSQQHGTNSF